MSTLVFLDSGPVGLLTNPNNTNQVAKIKEWSDNLRAHRILLVLSEIVDYEVRRELLRARRYKALSRLEEFKRDSIYIPLDTKTMHQAAELWAMSRQKGVLTAPDPALDGDIILAAQVWLLENAGYSVIVATNNVKHLDFFVDARQWQTISIDDLG